MRASVLPTMMTAAPLGAMYVDLSDGRSDAKRLQAAASLRRQGWVILIVGLGGSAILIALIVGFVPGFANEQGVTGVIALSLGAVFLAGAGLGSWWLWQRIANFRTLKAVLTDRGISVDFVNGTSAQLEWADPALRFSIREPMTPSEGWGSTLEWGSGGMGHYAHLSRPGADRIKAEAAVHGFRANAKSTGKPPNAWCTTTFYRN